MGKNELGRQSYICFTAAYRSSLLYGPTGRTQRKSPHSSNRMPPVPIITTFGLEDALVSIVVDLVVGHRGVIEEDVRGKVSFGMLTSDYKMTPLRFQLPGLRGLLKVASIVAKGRT